MIKILILIWIIKLYLKESGSLSKKKVVGKHVFITGAAMGLGKGFAYKFAKLGAKVSMADVNLELVKEH